MTAVRTFALALLLAGCGSRETEDAGRGGADNAPAEAVTAGNAVAPAKANSTAATQPEVSAIPMALRGRWGMVPADCEPGRSDAKGLLVVSPDRLVFYESRGKLGKIAEHDATRIVADFAFSGEGTTWTRRMVLDGQDGGRTLIRGEYGEDTVPGPIRYRKCA